MGCVFSRQDINDVHSDTFSVINVDDQVMCEIFFKVSHFLPHKPSKLQSTMQGPISFLCKLFRTHFLQFNILHT